MLVSCVPELNATMEVDDSFRNSSSSPGNDDTEEPAGDGCDAGISSPKKRRAAVAAAAAEKRVVTVTIGEASAEASPRNKAGFEGAPPTDQWAWRKYGQKPIKGSPFPRGYYRCSSSKGCPARKQVERSRVDPTTLVVTYSADHNHSSPPISRATSNQASPRSKHRRRLAAPEGMKGAADLEERISDLVCDELPPPLVLPPAVGGDEFWLGDDGSPSSSTSPPPAEVSDDTLLYGSIAGVAMIYAPEDLGGGDRKKREGEEDDALFAGLGELPECSVVLRRGDR